MSEVQWIKITTNIFDDEKIQLIEALPESDSILVIWLKLLALSGKSNCGGLIMISEKVPYTKEMLSIIFRRKQSVIDLALMTFENFGMVEILDNNAILISNWEKHQNIGGMEKIKLQNKVRQQRFRDEKKLLLGVAENTSCVYCGKKATGVDHIIATANGGKNIDSNYVPCCYSCNRIKNNQPLVNFLNFNRDIIIDDSVCNNENLKKHIKLNNVTNRYEITLRNAIDKELELDKELDKKEIKDNVPLPYKEIIEYLNKKVGRNYNHSTESTKKHIKARFNEKYTLQDFYKVIDIKYDEWNNTDFAKFLRPETLFGSKFESYLNQPHNSKPTKPGELTEQQIKERYGEA